MTQITQHTHSTCEDQSKLWHSLYMERYSSRAHAMDQVMKPRGWEEGKRPQAMAATKCKPVYKVLCIPREWGMSRDVIEEEYPL